MHPAKRRRTGVANVVPNKPFRSPVRVDRGKPIASAGQYDDKHSQSSKPATPIGPSSHSESSRNASSITRTAPSEPLEHTRHLDNLSASSLESSTTGVLGLDQNYAVLQKQYRTLSLQLKELTRSLDTASQALDIIQSNEEGRLEVLIKKWQAISREAAEDLFSTAADRVRQMGGFEAWRNDNSSLQSRHWWDDNVEPGENSLSIEEKERLEIAKQEAEAEFGNLLPGGDTVSPEEKDVNKSRMGSSTPSSA